MADFFSSNTVWINFFRMKLVIFTSNLAQWKGKLLIVWTLWKFNFSVSIADCYLIKPRLPKPNLLVWMEHNVIFDVRGNNQVGKAMVVETVLSWRNFSGRQHQLPLAATSLPVSVFFLHSHSLQAPVWATPQVKANILQHFYRLFSCSSRNFSNQDKTKETVSTRKYSSILENFVTIHMTYSI